MFIRDGELQGLRTCGEDLSGGTAGKEEESEGGAVGGHCVVLCLRQICWVRGEGWEVAVRGISEDAKLGTTTEGVVLHFTKRKNMDEEQHINLRDIDRDVTQPPSTSHI